MGRQSKTWENQANYIFGFMRKEQANPDRSLFIVLANEGVDIISRDTMGFETYWDNSATGDLTIVGNEVSLPIDCLRIDSVEWDGSENQLDRVTQAQLDSGEDDESSRGWRDQTGSPSRFVTTGGKILLDSAPDGVVTGRLVVRGVGMYPHFTEDNSTNPLEHLPATDEYMFAYYALAELPFDPEIPVEILRQQKFSSKWEKARSAVVDGIGVIRREPFRY